MKLKDLFTYLLSALILTGLYFQLTAAVISAYVILTFSVGVMIIGLFALPHLDGKGLREIKTTVTVSKFVMGIIITVAYVSVLFITMQYSLLFYYLISTLFSYLFLFKVFTTQEKD